MKKFTFILLLFIPFLGYSQTTAIPGKNFEQALIDLGIDTDGTINASVLTSDISGVTTLDVSDKNITDLTGIEDFTALTTLNCYSNDLTSLNVSKNIALEKLNCAENKLKSLDLRNGNNKDFFYDAHNDVYFFSTYANPNLKCILVDDASYCTKKWRMIDKTSKFVNKESECK